MRPPWQNLTGLAKSAAIFASILVISLGLCGLNALAIGHSEGELASLLFATGVLELLGIVLGTFGIVAVVLAALVQWIHHRFFSNLK